MNIPKRIPIASLCAAIILCGAGAALAQKPVVRSRVIEEVNDTRTVQTKGNIHPLARAEFDRGAVAESQPVSRMLLLLQRSPEQEAALQQLLQAQQSKGSASYHAWLTPQQFGAQFGPSDADVQKVTDWLGRQGFQVSKVSNGRTTIEFSGTAAQVRNAFHTELHKFAVNGKEHFANVSDPSIPEALAPVVKGVVALHNFRKKAAIHTTGRFRQNVATGQVTPLFTFADVNGTFYAVGPQDFAKIYNVPATPTGAGQSIAIVGRSNINIQDVKDFRSIFSLPANDPQIILNGPDPGLVDGDEGESDLDVQWAGAVAPLAKIILVTTQSSETDFVDGVDASAIYIVDNNVAPVMSNSYGSCESALGTSGNAFYNALWQQAAAEGITVVVAAGDNGSAGCDNVSTVTSASQGLAVSGIASTPYNIAMGGTDFNYAAGVTTYWDNTPGQVSSAKGYIPELPWNDSCAATGLTGCANVTSSSSTLQIAAGSGGSSTVYTTKPSWQAGLGPDTHRDLPDVSLFSGDGVNGTSNAGTFYVVCQSDQDIPGDTGCSLTKFSTTSPFHDFMGVGGTSAAAPTFAAIIALVNAKTGQSQGVANYSLYALRNTAGVFHDITSGNISVPCGGGTTNCSKTSTGGFGVLTTLAGGNILAYAASTGYDLATGLGSVDVTNLLNAWTSASFTGTTVTLNAPSPSTFTVGASVSISGSVAKTSGTGTPTGFVILENATTHAPIDTFSLNSSGNFSGTTTFIPGAATASYTILAHYGGDGTFGPSDSATQTVTVTKQSSKAVVSWVSFNGNNPVLSTGAQSVTYGSPYILRIDVTDSTGTPCENVSTGAIGYLCPTGQISLFKNAGSPLNDFPNAQTPNATNVASLNDRGFAEDQPIQLDAGAYSITATYAGDNSYSSQATSNTLNVTITPASTQVALSSNLGTVSVNQSVTFTAQILSQSNSQVGTTGTVTFSNGGVAIGSPVQVTMLPSTSTAGAGGVATLTTSFSTPGTKTITAHYAGDNNYSASSVDGSLTLSVTGGGPGSISVSASSVTVLAGGSAPSTITVTPNAFTGTASISCTGASLPSGVTCSPSPLSVAVSGNTAATGTLTLSVLAPSTSLSAQSVIKTESQFAAKTPRGSDLRSTMVLAAGGGLTFLFFFGLFGGKQLRSTLLGAILCVSLVAWGCGGGGSSGGGGGGGNASTTTAMTVSATKVPLATGVLNISVQVSSTTTPTGTVQFYDGATVFGSPVTITNGGLSLSLTQANASIPVVGTHSISAHYLGDSTHTASQSGQLNITITGTTTVALTTTPTTTGASIPLTIN